MGRLCVWLITPNVVSPDAATAICSISLLPMMWMRSMGFWVLKLLNTLLGAHVQDWWTRLPAGSYR